MGFRGVLSRSWRVLNEDNSNLLIDFNFYPDCEGGIGMKLEIDIPKHQYKNIMALDSISLGRAPYKGIIRYAINAIKRGKALEQEPRKGHWIKTGDYYTGAYGSIEYAECSCCHEDSLEDGNYCPNCGAKMAESEEE